MSKIQLSFRKVLVYIAIGIRNKKYEAVLDIIEDCIKQMPEEALNEEVQTEEETLRMIRND